MKKPCMTFCGKFRVSCFFATLLFSLSCTMSIYAEGSDGEAFFLMILTARCFFAPLFSLFSFSFSCSLFSTSLFLV